MKDQRQEKNSIFNINAKGQTALRTFLNCIPVQLKQPQLRQILVWRSGIIGQSMYLLDYEITLNLTLFCLIIMLVNF